MKKIFAILIGMIFLVIVPVVFGATLPLKGTWTAPTTNADGTALTDLASYNIYRTDGTRTKINSSPILASAAQPYLFSITLPDNSSGTLTFVITAVDTNNNESADSIAASYHYNLDTIPPSAPANLLMQK